jgi:8-oxo-dGTP pyrophosphatase MutT (NUDIX family)
VTFADATARLDAALRRGDLPGAAAHALLAPRPRRAWPPGFNPARIRHAAGLLLVFPKAARADAAIDRAPAVGAPSPGSSDDDAHLVLTVRADTLGRHGGQVSLPGGAIEPGETFARAALREAHEEVGLATAGVRIIGALTPLDIPVSGFRLHPIVAALNWAPALAAADGEVARIVEVPIADLLDASRLRVSERDRDGQTLAVPAFHLAGVEIWGATAMVLAEFLTLLGWIPKRS